MFPVCLTDAETYLTPVPSAGVFDAPGIQLCLNTVWASFLDGLLGQLLDRCLWAGTETQVDAALQEVQKLLVKLADVGECPPMIPIGTILPFGGVDVPPGFLFCHGQALSRASYWALYLTIGTSYGYGDGQTTFNLPDLRGRTLVGAGQGEGLTGHSVGEYFGEEEHQLTVSEMPEHSHLISASVSTQAGTARISYYGTPRVVGFNVTTESEGDNMPHNNVPPSSAVNFIIYAGV